MQALDSGQLWSEECKLPEQFWLYGCTKGCQIKFIVTSPQIDTMVQLIYSHGDNDGVSSFIPYWGKNIW